MFVLVLSNNYRPEIRDYLIKSRPDLLEKDFLALLSRCSNINWSAENGDMICINPMTDALVLSNAFDRWSKDINNWSLQRSMAVKFPALADKAWIKGEDTETEYDESVRAFRDLIDCYGDPTFTSETFTSP